MAPAPTSVAVLYFDNLSRDTSDAYLADGLTEEVTSRLGEIQRLDVKSRNAVRPFRGEAAADLAAVGRRLRVRYLVEGSIRRAGARVRVSVRLVRAESGFRLWGADYDRNSSDLLSLQEEIAREVATNIAGRLLPQERARLAARPTQSAEAYEHFLRGNFHLARRTPDAFRRAIDEYAAAARRDTGFARADARLALASALFVEWGFAGTGSDSVLARGFQAVARALALDSSEADTWLARGYLLAQRNPRTLEGALPALERAMALDPRNAEVVHQYGWLLWIGGRDEDALAAYRRALALEPGRAITHEHMARLLYGARRHTEALRVVDSAIAEDPTQPFYHRGRLFINVALGDTNAARADLGALRRFTAPDDRITVPAAEAFLEARTGNAEGARRTLDSLLAGLPMGALAPWTGFFLGAAFAAAGARERALDLIERVEPRSAAVWAHLRFPEYDPIRDSPRFQRVVDELRPPGAPR